MLSAAFNCAVLQLCARVLPCGFDVDSVAPDTLEDLTAHYLKTGRVLVWNGASDATIFGDAYVNWAFRAWHDAVHIQGQFAFTPEGEALACEVQVDQLLSVYGTLSDSATWVAYLRAEINGQVEYQANHGGDFPTNQLAFMKRYLVAPDLAVVENF